MSELSLQKLEKVADTYERLLMPALFEEWAPRLADAAAIRAGQDVLDVACGTGILARTLARHVDPDGSVTGVDINPAMLAVARRSSSTVGWHEGDAESLPFDDDSFDAVVSQFGLMLFADPEAALREMWRVLRPEGRLAVAVFDSLERLPAYAAMADVYEHRVDKAVGDALRMPFSMGDTDELASLFAAAGIGAAAITTKVGRARFASVRQMVLADVQGWFPFAQIHLDGATVEAVVQEAEAALVPFQTEQGAVVFRVPVHIITATAS